MKELKDQLSYMEQHLCGIGLHDVQEYLNVRYEVNDDFKARILKTSLNIEYINLKAKIARIEERANESNSWYRRKDFLLYLLRHLFTRSKKTYGGNGMDLIAFDMGDVILSWHVKQYDRNIPKWDGVIIQEDNLTLMEMELRDKYFTGC